MPEDKIKNPFLHQHDDHDHDHHHHHHHHHHDDEEDLQQLDPAQQSLADALRLSFNILKFAMLGLLLFYLGSGIFVVQEQERALRLRFGAIVGDATGAVHEPGFHFGLPYPIEQVVRIPVTTRTIDLTQSFWHAGEQRPGAAPGLNPEVDGFLLSGDANIVHGQFSVTYQVDDPVSFAEHVGLARPGVDELPGGRVARHRMSFADRLVQQVAERAIVHTTAQMEADVFIRSGVSESQVISRAQRALEEMNTGLRVTRLTNAEHDMPEAVRDAYRAVVEAESERGNLIDEARQERARLLGEAAGEGYAGLYALIEAYEQAHDLEQREEAAELESLIRQALDRRLVPDAYGGLSLGGEVARIISEANTYRSTLRERVAAEAGTYESLLADYRRTPRLLQTRLWQNARERILMGEVETFYVMDGQFYPVINRDPRIQREREERRLREEEEQRTGR